MGIASLTSSVNLVGNTAIESMDVSKIGQGGFYNTGVFTTTLGDSKSWAEVVSSTIGAGITSGMNAWNIGTKGIKVDGFNSSQIGNMGSLNSLVGNLAGSAVTYGMTGNATFNILNTSDLGFGNTGLFELTVGNDGVSSRIGMGGTSVTASLLISAAKGAQNWNKNIQIEKAAKYNKLDIGTSLRSQWGFGDAKAKEQLASVINKDTIFEAGGTDGQAETRINEKGQRVVSLTDYKENMTREEKLALGITMQHEAYRDGVKGSKIDQNNEVVNAVFGKTAMALRMAGDSLYGQSIILNDSELTKEALLFSLAQIEGDDLFVNYILDTYDTSEDYARRYSDYEKTGMIGVQKGDGNSFLNYISSTVSSGLRLGKGNYDDNPDILTASDPTLRGDILTVASTLLDIGIMIFAKTGTMS